MDLSIPDLEYDDYLKLWKGHTKDNKAPLVQLYKSAVHFWISYPEGVAYPIYEAHHQEFLKRHFDVSEHFAENCGWLKLAYLDLIPSWNGPTASTKQRDTLFDINIFSWNNKEQYEANLERILAKDKYGDL